MYTIERKVQFSECGPDEKLRFSDILNYFQDCSTAQSESLGVGSGYTKGLGKAWILSAWQVEFCRQPALGEKVKVTTWPSGFQGFYGYRNYTLETGDGEVLAYANSIWVYMDLIRKRPCRPTEKELEAYVISPAYPMEYAPRKIAVPEETKEQESRRVRRIHLDCNGHMNNVRYLEMALEYIPETYDLHQVRIDYRKEAHERDRIVPRIAQEEERIIVELCDEAGNIYATIEFTGEEK